MFSPIENANNFLTEENEQNKSPQEQAAAPNIAQMNMQ